MQVRIATMLNAVTVTGASAVAGICSTGQKVFQATVTGTGAVTATVQIRASMDGANPIVIGTITLSGTTTATDALVISAPWAYLDANATALTGTGAKLTVICGEVP